MDILDRESVVSLANPSGWPSLSVYMPMHRLPVQTDQDRIRLKNLLNQSVEMLSGQGLREPDAEALVAPMRSVLESDDFWREGAQGLAAFVSRGLIRILRTMEPMPESVTLGDRFYLRPLARALQTEGRFYALALDKNATRLFRSDRFSFERVDLGETPTTFDEAMKYDDEHQRQLGHRSADPNRVTGHTRQHGGSIYSGHGGEGDLTDEHTTRFARMVEHGVCRVLANEQAPLLLLGIERMLSAYRAVNTYSHLLDEQVTGATDYMSDGDIEGLARKAMEPVLAAATAAQLAALAEQEGSSLISHDPQEIVAAAATGRVRALYFDDASGPYGTFDRESMQVSRVCSASPRLLRESAEPESQISPEECGWDLVDLAAAETALHGGEVIGFSGEQSPIKGVAALYRY